MKDILVVNGDVAWSGDELVLVKGDEYIKQQAYLRTIADKGESSFHTAYGSWLFKYLGRSYSPSNKAHAESAVRDALNKVAGIEEVISVELKPVKITSGGSIQTNYYVFAKFKTTDGEIISDKYNVAGG